MGEGAGAAFVRQGIKELGVALKPLPDSISVDEPGTAFNPTQGEIAEANRGGALYGRLQQAQERAASREPPTPGLERE